MFVFLLSFVFCFDKVKKTMTEIFLKHPETSVCVVQGGLGSVGELSTGYATKEKAWIALQAMPAVQERNRAKRKLAQERSPEPAARPHKKSRLNTGDPWCLANQSGGKCIRSFLQQPALPIKSA